MTEEKWNRHEQSAEVGSSTQAADEAERTLGRWVALGLPVLTVALAAAIALLSNLGSALLVLASGTLLSAIFLLWASVRTLSGDAPLPADLEALTAQTHAVDELAERKRRALSALRDLENEHALGKIDDADYEAFVGRYREDAKGILREMDERVAPLREQAERMLRERLAQTEKGGRSTARQVSGVGEKDGGRVVCAGCGASNERDAAFCKSCGAAMKQAGAR